MRRRVADRGEIGTLLVGEFAALEHGDVVQYDTEQIREVVCDPSRKSASAFEALGLAQPRFEFGTVASSFGFCELALAFDQRRLRLALFADIAQRHDDTIKLRHRLGTTFIQEFFASGVEEAHFYGIIRAARTFECLA